MTDSSIEFRGLINVLWDVMYEPCRMIRQVSLLENLRDAAVDCASAVTWSEAVLLLTRRSEIITGTLQQLEENMRNPWEDPDGYKIDMAEANIAGLMATLRKMHEVLSSIANQGHLSGQTLAGMAKDGMDKSDYKIKNGVNQ